MKELLSPEDTVFSFCLFFPPLQTFPHIKSEGIIIQIIFLTFFIDDYYRCAQFLLIFKQENIDKLDKE